MDLIINFDTRLFYFFNVALANPITDFLMPIITQQNNWYPVYLFLVIFLVIKYKNQGVWIVSTLVLAVALGDYINSSIIKELVGRTRPCATLTDIHLLVSCGPGKSFMSSHAVNNFALAFVLSKHFRKNKWIFYVLATMIAYSRIAVGVHYPLDVICGGLLGVFFGWLSILIINHIQLKFSKK